MQKDVKLRKTTKRIAHILERSGYRISLPIGILSEIFDITCDSVYSPVKDSGLYIAIGIDIIPKELLDAITSYRTYRKKELWILKRGKSSSDPGTFLIFRFDDGKLVEHPENCPIEKVMSSPKKRRANLQK